MVSTSQDRNAGNAGLGWKAPVRAASVANLTLSAEQTVDGIALVEGDRVLVKDQSTAAQNGIYIVRSGAWDRAPDWDGSGDVTNGTFVFVANGTTLDNTVWNVTTSGTIVIGTTSVAFQQFSTVTAAFATQTEVNAGASAATLVSPSTLAGRPTFLATKGGSNQASITSNTNIKLTFTTEVWDTGSYYNSTTSVWTPPAGKYRISANALFTSANAVDNETLRLLVYKNGSQHRRNGQTRGSTGSDNASVNVLVEANGTDTFEIYAYKSGAGDGTIDGGVEDTWLSAETI